MITAIRDIRLARGLTLDDVARRCDPPTTPQTLSRLETGNRTVSVAWLNRIAAAIGVPASDLVTLPTRTTLPVLAILGPAGATAPRRLTTVSPPTPSPGMVAITIGGSVGEYRAGDVLWCEMVAPPAFGAALNRDVLAPRPAGRFVFGRLIAREGARVTLLPPGVGARQQVIADVTWLARPTLQLRTI